MRGKLNRHDNKIDAAIAMYANLLCQLGGPVVEHPGVLGPPVQHDDGAPSLVVPSGDRQLPAAAGITRGIDPDHRRRIVFFSLSRAMVLTS